MTDSNTAGGTNCVKLCPYCGAVEHPAKCPLVSAFEYHPTGALKRVEFHGPAPIHYASPPFPLPGPEGWKIT